MPRLVLTTAIAALIASSAAANTSIPNLPKFWFPTDEKGAVVTQSSFSSTAPLTVSE